MTVETSALYRIERTLGLHALRRVATWWALARAQRAWKVEPWRTWLTDHRKAFAATFGHSRSKYSTALRNVRARRKRERPEIKARETLRRREETEVDVRERLLRVDGQYRSRRAAIDNDRYASIVIGVAVAVLVGGWASFGFVMVPGGATRTAPLLTVAWLLAPPMVAFGAMGWAVRTQREARIGRGRLDAREALAQEYDRAWARLADAEHAAGVAGVAKVVAPRLWAGTGPWGLWHRPSSELLSVPLPDFIDMTARKLREGDARTVAEFESRATGRGYLVAPDALSRTDAEKLREDFERTRADHERVWGAVHLQAARSRAGRSG